eukprot:757734-Hanusia_phi.AAC.3
MEPSKSMSWRSPDPIVTTAADPSEMQLAGAARFIPEDAYRFQPESMHNVMPINPMYLQPSQSNNMYYPMPSQVGGPVHIGSAVPYNSTGRFGVGQHVQQHVFDPSAEQTVAVAATDQVVDQNPFFHGDWWETEFKVKISDQDTTYYKRVNVNMLPPAGCSQRLLDLLFHQDSARDTVSIQHCSLVFEMPDGGTFGIESDSDLHFIVSHAAMRGSKSCVRLNCMRRRMPP